MPLLHLLSGGAAHGLVNALRAQFEYESGRTIEGTYGAVGALKEKLLAGAPADLLILTQGMIADLEREGLVLPGSAMDIGIVHTGIAVRAGDPAPPIGTAAALREALAAADAIYVPDPAHATAGKHFARVLSQLGLAEAAAQKLRSFPNGAAAMAALASHAGGRPIGCTQITEIIGTAGTALAGRLPHELELGTVYTAGIATRAADPDGARQLAEVLSENAARPHRERAGFST